MAKVRVLRKQDRAYIELPPEMAGQSELELFQLKEGYYLISFPLAQPADQSRANAPDQQSNQLGPDQANTKTNQPNQYKTDQNQTKSGRDNGINEQERLLLQKLLSIRFESRTPALVARELSDEEGQILSRLVQNGLVNVYRGNKYKNGVYSIRDSIYPLITQEKRNGQTQVQTRDQIVQNTQPETQMAQSQASQVPHPQTTQPAMNMSNPTIALLHSQGFAIVQDKRETMILSEQLSPQMKSGAILGVKGFDGKVYVVTRKYFNGAQAAINTILKEDMDSPSIANATKLDPEGCLAVLKLMAESGELLERKRGVFAPV